MVIDVKLVVIIFQYIHILKHYTVHLKLMLYVTVLQLKKSSRCTP